MESISMMRIYGIDDGLQFLAGWPTHFDGLALFRRLKSTRK